MPGKNQILQHACVCQMLNEGHFDWCELAAFFVSQVHGVQAIHKRWAHIPLAIEKSRSCKIEEVSAKFSSILLLFKKSLN